MRPISGDLPLRAVGLMAEHALPASNQSKLQDCRQDSRAKHSATNHFIGRLKRARGIGQTRNESGSCLAKDNACARIDIAKREGLCRTIWDIPKPQHAGQAEPQDRVLPRFTACTKWCDRALAAFPQHGLAAVQRCHPEITQTSEKAAPGGINTRQLAPASVF